jgi:competence protein ComEA
MDKNKYVGFLIAGVAAAVVLLAYFLPKHNVTSAVALPASQATVPPQLLTSEGQASPDFSPTNAQATPPRVVVYVCGHVRRPGVYEMPPGARVADGISRAGGALADADLEQLNLAQPLSDAMKVDVPRKGEHPAIVLAAGDTSGQPASHRARHYAGRSSHKLQPGQTLDINTASEAELTQLPGVGPSLAARIVEYRTENGPFQSVDDLQNVSGIGPSKFDKMVAYLRL